MSGFVAMAWTSLNEEASGYYQCLSVYQLALESLIPADRYIVRVYSNVTTEVEFVLKTSCGYLLAGYPLASFGGVSSSGLSCPLAE